jgi:hypothetical protein
MSFFDAKEEKRLAICLKTISENPRVKMVALARKNTAFRMISFDGGHNKRLNTTQDKG